MDSEDSVYSTSSLSMEDKKLVALEGESIRSNFAVASWLSAGEGASTAAPSLPLVESTSHLSTPTLPIAKAEPGFTNNAINVASNATTTILSENDLLSSNLKKMLKIGE